MTATDNRPPSAKNRRASRRRYPRTSVKLECRKGSLGLGPNVAVRLLDLSETGARLVLRTPLTRGQEVEVVLNGFFGKGLKRQGVVIWAVALADGSCCVGVHFGRLVSYADLDRLTTQ